MRHLLLFFFILNFLSLNAQIWVENSDLSLIVEVDSSICGNSDSLEYKLTIENKSIHPIFLPHEELGFSVFNGDSTIYINIGVDQMNSLNYHFKLECIQPKEQMSFILIKPNQLKNQKNIDIHLNYLIGNKKNIQLIDSEGIIEFANYYVKMQFLEMKVFPRSLGHD